MWYVVQVYTGREENIKHQCESLLPLFPDAFERVFIPYSNRRMKIEGEWGNIERVLFPGYIFIVTSNLYDAVKLLRKVEGMTKILGDGENMIPISKEEEEMLRRLGGEEQIVEMSEGIIENSVLKVTEGPLKGMEPLIKKIDRHKRRAWIEVEMFGAPKVIEVGLEIFRKDK